MTNKVDAYNQIIIEKKEQVNELLNEKKQINGWLDDYHDFTTSTTGLYHHLAERYYKSDMFSRCLLYTSPSPRDGLLSRMPSSA